MTLPNTESDGFKPGTDLAGAFAAGRMKSKNLALVSASALLLVDLDTRNVIPLDTEILKATAFPGFPGGAIWSSLTPRSTALVLSI
ncbi:MAG: hypothetical protein IJI03_20105 [Rudaea sp.]|nr:hypothetical protein [Rudaea sp.]